MRLAAALTLSAALLLGTAQPAAAAPSVDLRPPGTVVVGPGTGTYATFAAGGVPASIRAMDLYLYSPDGDRAMVDLQIRNRPGIWEGEYKFHRSEGFGRWKAVLTMRDDAGRPSKGGTAHFTVKRRTTLSTTGSKSRGSGISGVLRKMKDNGRYTAYAEQKVALYRWNGSWAYVATDVTDGRGRYSFKTRSGRLQIRYAGNGLDAGAVRTVN
ncbi:hypothetical protein [Actinocorallia populi]|uniref:hypothetical protein n=1 Tax=Actinocorallia populi TaxID=2079200 RepID=UPI000D08E4C3|nr:hypothetical protein [Actinocorallia populi]